MKKYLYLIIIIAVISVFIPTASIKVNAMQLSDKSVEVVNDYLDQTTSLKISNEITYVSNKIINKDLSRFFGKRVEAKYVYKIKIIDEQKFLSGQECVFYSVSDLTNNDVNTAMKVKIKVPSNLYDSINNLEVVTQSDSGYTIKNYIIEGDYIVLTNEECLEAYMLVVTVPINLLNIFIIVIVCIIAIMTLSIVIYNFSIRKKQLN